MIRLLSTLFIAVILANSSVLAQVEQTKGTFKDKFRQLDEILPTPNVYRNAAGEPGHKYWQQKVDYKIKATLLEDKRRLEAIEEITYTNNSPDTLRYLWLQLDQNRFKKDSMAEKSTAFAGIGRRGPGTKLGNRTKAHGLSMEEIRRQQYMDDNRFGYDVLNVTDAKGNPLNVALVGTNLRVDLKSPLKPGKKVKFNVEFAFNIVDENIIYARGGYEHFPNDKREGGNDIFLFAQWFPRLHAYTDYEAWTNKEFLGRGEFTLEFGDYELEMTVPADHIVSSTGTLQNPKDVLTKEQMKRLKEAETADKPHFIVTAAEALENEAAGTDAVKTWKFDADNVRDFAWATSRKFMWDAQGYQQDGADQELVMAMSFYPKEGGDLWKKYSTASIIHTMEVYGHFTFDYPYPTSQSVNGPVGGMEYPMITFNGPRTKLHKDGTRTYSEGMKKYLIGVVIHEVGHNYFPMIVNSDERQWTWMDEGLNSFLDAVAGREWDTSVSWGAEPKDIVAYMKSDKQVPIMTQADSLWRPGPNAYAKPAVALNILRETILGRELFDFAFKEYSRRWKFKRPTPSDFFRTMEEASGVDLDWFWRGWFYTTDHVDISLDAVYKLRVDTKNPLVEKPVKETERLEKHTKSIFLKQNAKDGKKTWMEKNEDIRDFYDEVKVNDILEADHKALGKYLKGLEKDKDYAWQRTVFERAIKDNKSYYILELNNKGGLVMPVILGLEFTDGSRSKDYIPAEIWRRTPDQVHKLLVFPKGKELKQVVLDPDWETSDTDLDNNYYPRQIIPSRVEIYKGKGYKPSRMKKWLDAEKKKADDAKKAPTKTDKVSDKVDKVTEK
ncbi:M1 family metallopeptidase [Temperatibacter marinus]|uniref:M1 family metallopeptidase n=1 Tax=Temperatibacter marinus TaxID=1456591 RepID=A0AA52HBK1_9PROT|nr:M1 family metallopeptidase [Temperatibacter marinus]WND03830.1 M1 family metallopeptidase [Temperatibacter marinus]